MQIEPFYADTKRDITTATTVVSQMVESNKVDVLVGMTDTSFMLATGPVAQKASVPFMDVGGTAPVITDTGDFIFMLPIVVGGDGYDMPLLTDVPGPEKLANVFFSTHLGVYGDDPTAGKFKAAFNKEFGADPQSVFAALGYDGVNLMADAIKRAGSADHKAIRDALAATKGWKGASGEITYPPGERIPSKSVALIEVKDGKFNLLSIVVSTKIPAL